MSPVRISAPLTDAMIESLKSGDRVLISGILYTGRDAAHKRLFALIKENRQLPFDLQGQIIYYVGPAPASPGKVVGPAGPTTSGRMDSYTPDLLALGLKGMLGKGPRSGEVIEAIKKYKAVYFTAVGGAAVLLAKHIKASEVVAYPELGTEAIHKFTVEDFPAIVAIDSLGNDLFKTGIEKFRITNNVFQ
ncbi:MAG: Fe-S-containing hydro-lyase [Candidatus Omnitrophica bacterium]|nr:Fe-S-containing hydro-lyase [Candidatus Omnitrophota bacterium]